MLDALLPILVVSAGLLDPAAQTAAKREGPTSLAELARMIERAGDETQAEAVVRAFRRRYSRETEFKVGSHRPLVEQTLVGWFLHRDDATKVEVVAEDGKRWPLRRLAKTGYHAAVATLPAIYESRYRYHADGKPLAGGTIRIEHFPLGRDSRPQPGVPQGRLVKMPDWKSQIYRGTTRSWWVYVPAQYNAAEGACLMVFQDGESYAMGDGNACIVFDNLIHQKKMPPTLGVFVNPGIYPEANPRPGRRPRSSRSDEYDTCTPRYAEFLDNEILAEVAKQYRIKPGGMNHAICGISSGGSCAFTTAWYRPDLFGRVLSHVGSFCDFRPIEKYPTLDGKNPPAVDDVPTWKVAHTYPFLIRKTRPRKPLRIFLQAGARDLDNPLGNWPLANQQMDRALAFAGYKYKFVMGEGFHSLNHGRAILPESLVWLWAND